MSSLFLLVFAMPGKVKKFISSNEKGYSILMTDSPSMSSGKMQVNPIDVLDADGVFVAATEWQDKILESGVILDGANKQMDGRMKMIFEVFKAGKGLISRL